HQPLRRRERDCSRLNSPDELLNGCRYFSEKHLSSVVLVRSEQSRIVKVAVRADTYRDCPPGRSIPFQSNVPVRFSTYGWRREPGWECFDKSVRLPDRPAANGLGVIAIPTRKVAVLVNRQQFI